MSTPHPDRSLTVDEARGRIAQAMTPVDGWETVPVRDALARVLYGDVMAPFDVPAHDNSAMDGYALRSPDLDTEAETRLQLVGTALAGSAFSGIVGPGQAVRIMTGAVMPRGADTVVEQEVTRAENGAVFIPPGRKAGQNVRLAGEDLAQGQPALFGGKRVGPAELGLIASLGYGEIQVRRRLRVAFFSTGDELASIGRPLAPGEKMAALVHPGKAPEILGYDRIRAWVTTQGEKRLAPLPQGRSSSSGPQIIAPLSSRPADGAARQRRGGT